MNKNSQSIRLRKQAFTLLELLIVIGILATLATVVILVLNPTEFLKQSRDAKRLSEIKVIDDAIRLYAFNSNTLYYGTSSVVYLSLPDSNSECSSYTADLPSLSGGWSYACKPESEYRKTDGTGWIPVNFNFTQAGPPLAILPVDPVNNSSYYYAYIPGSWSLTIKIESAKYLPIAQNDGGYDSVRFELGSDLALWNASGAGSTSTGSSWACGDALVDARDGKSYATVLIGSQCWLAQHINIGTLIAGVSNMSDNASIEKYCYSNTESNCTSDGGLYQWGEAMQYAASCNGTGAPPNDACAAPVQGICPSGWHIPSHYEYVTLERAVCTSGTCATDFPYDTSTISWQGTDEGTKLKVGGLSGFEGLLAGYRTIGGGFGNRGTFAHIWSSLESGANAWSRHLYLNYATVRWITDEKLSGFSVRCVKD